MQLRLADFGATSFTSAASAVGAAGADADHSLRQLAHVAGYAAYTLMCATVVWGLLTTAGTVRHSVRRETIYGAHMLLSIGAMCFAVVHAAAHLFKTVAPFRPVQEFVPFTTRLPVSFGVIGLEFMVVTAVSVWFQRRLSYGRWHRLHRWLAMGSFGPVVAHVLLTAHGLLSPPVAIALSLSLAGCLLMAVLRLRPTQGDPLLS